MRPHVSALAAAAAIGVLGLALPLFSRSDAAGKREVYDPSLYGFTGPRGCVMPSTPPYLFAMAMRAPSHAAAESLAWRLGLEGKWEQDLYVCVLQGDGALMWVAGPRLPRGVRVPAGPVAALVHREYEPEDPELPMGLTALRLPGPPRNTAPGEPGAFRCAIALVPSVDRVVREWPPAKSAGDDIPLLMFGPWVDLPDLGARARRGIAGGSNTVLVMEPTHPGGLASRWLAERGAGWIGFELPFMDLDETRPVLESRGVHPREMRDHRTYWLPPDETGGALILFPAREPSGS